MAWYTTVWYAIALLLLAGVVFVIHLPHIFRTLSLSLFSFSLSLYLPLPLSLSRSLPLPALPHSRCDHRYRNRYRLVWGYGECIHIYIIFDS